jgi:hypothetical protein
MVQAEEHKFEVSEGQREFMHRGDYSWVRPQAALGCYMRVWDEGHNFPSEARHEVLFETDRADSCFFFPHSPGIFFQTAQEILEKRSQRGRFALTTRLTIYGLIIALIGIIIAIIAVVR